MALGERTGQRASATGGVQAIPDIFSEVNQELEVIYLYSEIKESTNGKWTNYHFYSEGDGHLILSPFDSNLEASLKKGQENRYFDLSQLPALVIGVESISQPKTYVNPKNGNERTSRYFKLYVEAIKENSQIAALRARALQELSLQQRQSSAQMTDDQFHDNESRW